MILFQRTAAAHKIAILLLAMSALNPSGGKLSDAHFQSDEKSERQEAEANGIYCSAETASPSRTQV